MNNKEEEEEEEYDICIIGGGLGGLSSINNLLESSKINLKIVLLEGRNRIGGRTNTIQLEQLEQQIKEQNKEEQILEQLEEQKEQLEVQREQREEEEKKEEEEDNNKKNCYVDIGGQWIGTDHFKALSFISKYSLKLEEQIYPHYNSNNNNENESHLLDSLVSMVSYQFPNLTNEEEEEINYFVKLIDELGSKLSLDTPWNIENASEMDVSIYDYVLKIISLPRAQQEIFIFIQTILATSPHDCSFLFFLYYIASGGGMRALGDGLHGAQRWKVIGGAQKISEKLLDDFLTRNNNQHTFKCYLSTPVRSISYIKDDNENNSNKLLVTTSNNLKEIKIKCKRIIIAMSPRLSNSTIQFNPPLPEPKQSLTNAMVPGACVKVLIPYYNEFWLSGINNHPIKGLKSLEEIYPMHNMFHSTVGPYPALVGLITGDHAKSYIKLNEQEKRQALLNQIHDLFCSPNPEYSDIEKSPAFYPIDIIEKSWINEPFSGGCFACLFRPNYFLNYGPYLKTPLGFPVPNSENNSELNWVTPLIDENIQYETAIEWASTETAPMFSGYMEGAILAGEEAAKRILSSL